MKRSISALFAVFLLFIAASAGAQTFTMTLQGARETGGGDPAGRGLAVITFNGGLNNLWAISGTVTGGFSAPVLLASGAGSNKYNLIGTAQVALNNAGQAAVAWTVLGGHTEALTRSPAGTWSIPTVLSTASSSSVSAAIDGAGNAVAVFGSSYSWDLADGSWGTPAALPPGSSGGRVAGEVIRTF